MSTTTGIMISTRIRNVNNIISSSIHSSIKYRFILHLIKFYNNILHSYISTLSNNYFFLNYT